MFSGMRGCRDEGEEAGRGDVTCPDGDRMEDLGEGWTRPLLRMGEGARGDAERQPGPSPRCAP